MPMRGITILTKSAAVVVLPALFGALLVFGATLPSDILERLPSLILGVNVNQVSAQSTMRLRSLRPEMVRLDGFSWDVTETKRGTYDFTASDAIMEWARRSQLNVLGIFQYAPGWANGQDFDTTSYRGISRCGIPDLEQQQNAFNKLRTYPPENGLDFRTHAFTPNRYADFGNYVRAAAERYRDVKYWQVWNEPNNPIFWPTGPSAQEYALMLKTVYGNIKEGNPEATVVLGGISLNDLDYINGLYNAGAKNYFDVMAVHLYNPSQAPNAYLAHELDTLHQAMADNGDADKDIWLTEIGWYTGTAPASVNHEQQGRYLEQVAAIAGSKPYVGALFWNTLVDCDTGYDATNPEHNFGIYNRNFIPKRAADVLRGIMVHTE